MLILPNIYGTKKNSSGGIKKTGFYHDYSDLETFQEAMMNEEKPNLHLKFAILNLILFHSQYLFQE